MARQREYLVFHDLGLVGEAHEKCATVRDAIELSKKWRMDDAIATVDVYMKLRGDHLDKS